MKGAIKLVTMLGRYTQSIDHGRHQQAATFEYLSSNIHNGLTSEHNGMPYCDISTN